MTWLYHAWIYYRAAHASYAGLSYMDEASDQIKGEKSTKGMP